MQAKTGLRRWSRGPRKLPKALFQIDLGCVPTDWPQACRFQRAEACGLRL